MPKTKRKTVSKGNSKPVNAKPAKVQPVNLRLMADFKDRSSAIRAQMADEFDLGNIFRQIKRRVGFAKSNPKQFRKQLIESAALAVAAADRFESDFQPESVWKCVLVLGLSEAFSDKVKNQLSEISAKAIRELGKMNLADRYAIASFAMACHARASDNEGVKIPKLSRTARRFVRTYTDCGHIRK